MKGCDNMPIIIGLTLIIIVFLHFSKSRGQNAKKTSEEFWQKDAILMLRFAITIMNTEGETLYYGMLPKTIANNIWQKESVDSYREDKKGNRFEILGGEVAVIYPGDVADGAFTTDGIY